MSSFQIFIVYVAFKGGGKKRPVLVVGHDNGKALFYNITTRYESKSDFIRSKYFPITDWALCGLDKPSYVDTNTVRDMPLAAITNTSPAGTLTDGDKRRFVEFLTGGDRDFKNTP